MILVPAGAVLERGKGAYLQLRSAPSQPAKVVVMPGNPRLYAARLYAVLHDLDDQGYDWIAVETPDDDSGMGRCAGPFAPRRSAMNPAV